MKPADSKTNRTATRLDRVTQYFVRTGVLKLDRRDFVHLTRPFMSRFDAILATVCPYGFRNRPAEVDELLVALLEVQTGKTQRPPAAQTAKAQPRPEVGTPKRVQDLKNLLCTFQILTRQGVLHPTVYATARERYPGRSLPYAPEIA